MILSVIKENSLYYYIFSCDVISKTSFVLDDKQDELENICYKFFHIKLLWKNFVSAT